MGEGGGEFFSLKIDSFSEGIGEQKSKQEVTRVIYLVTWQNQVPQGYSDLIVFSIEFHSNSTLFGSQGLISGYGWASKFCFNSKTRLSTAK